MHTFLVSTISVLVVLGIMVIVHEFGHFLAAKLCGVRVEAFSVGFGPRLFGIKVGDTDYKVCALPFGGYVKMTGENPGEEVKNDPGEFTQHPRWQRILIGFSGPAANFLLALGLMTGVLMFHHETYIYFDQPAVLDWVESGSVAAHAGLMQGDVIERFDTVDHPTWKDVEIRAQINLNHSVPVIVERGAQQIPLTLPLPDTSGGEDFALANLGLFPVEQPGPIRVDSVGDSTPASAAGIHAGDIFASVDGHIFHSTESLVAYMQERDGAPMSIALVHDGQQRKITITPVQMDDPHGGKAWRLGFTATIPPFRVEKLSFSGALAESWKFNRANSLLILEVLKRVLTHQMSVSTLSGPIGIAKQTGMAVEMQGWQPILQLMTVISLNLGILNLMPFPVLDGGLILFLLIESILRRDVDMAIKERIYQAGFILILVFAAYVVFNDVSKLHLFALHRQQ
jgi:regulator of sigma E protease